MYLERVASRIPKVRDKARLAVPFSRACVPKFVRSKPLFGAKDDSHGAFWVSLGSDTP